MQVGIDSFAAAFDENSRAVNPADRLRQLVEQIEHADEVAVDAFGAAPNQGMASRHFYSARSAASGSTWVARRAGRYVPMSATAASVADIAAYVTGSIGPTPNRKVDMTRVTTIATPMPIRIPVAVSQSP